MSLLADFMRSVDRNIERDETEKGPVCHWCGLDHETKDCLDLMSVTGVKNRIYWFFNGERWVEK